MKDSEARAVINLLTKRIEQLDRELTLIKTPHVKDCECDDCGGYAPDHFCIGFKPPFALWWEDNIEKGRTEK